MQGKKTWRVLGLAALLAVAAGLPVVALGQAETNATAADSTVAPAPGPTALPSPADADTVRTNLWLVEALMGEVVTASTTVLPPAPAAVRLVSGAAKTTQDEHDLFQDALFRVLGDLGYTVFLAAEDPALEGAVDLIYSYKVVSVELEYPDVGRTLGIWRSWVQREMKVAVQIEISQAQSGQLLLSDRLERRFGDRVPDDDFGEVGSGAFAFTNAETAESGWQRRMEEIVVLGTLAGLVAVYFANTGN